MAIRTLLLVFMIIILTCCCLENSAGKKKTNVEEPTVTEKPLSPGVSEAGNSPGKKKPNVEKPTATQKPLPPGISNADLNAFRSFNGNIKLWNDVGDLTNQLNREKERNANLTTIIRDHWPTDDAVFNPPLRSKRSTIPTARPSSSQFFCYDMEHSDNKIVKYSLTNITQCKKDGGRFEKPLAVEAVVLHINTETNTKVHGCRLTYTKLVHFCEKTFYRHYGSKHIAIEKPIILTQNECWHIIKYNEAKFHFEGKEIEFKTVKGGMTPHARFTHGGLDDEGWCQISNFHSEGNWWYSAYEETTFKLYRTDLPASIAKNYEGEPVLAVGDSDKIAADYHKGFLHDRSIGTAVWETPTETGNCSHGLYSVLFHDKANLFQVKKEYQDGKTRAFLLHDETTVEEISQTAASVLLLEQESLNGFHDCEIDSYLRGMTVYKTHIDGIHVAYREYTQLRFSQGKRLLADPSSMRGSDPALVNLHANLGYVSVKQGQDVSRILSSLWESMCSIEALVMRTKVNDAIGNGNPYAFADIFKPGQTMIPRGSIAYLIEGTPVPVEIRATSSCMYNIFSFSIRPN